MKPPMEGVATLIAAEGTRHLDGSTIGAARQALAEAGAEVGEPTWLSPGIACDIPFSGLEPRDADAALRTALPAAPFDIVAHSAPERRKRLLIADMDSTIVTSETLDELADFAGLKEKVAAITRRAMNGEIDFKGALRERVGMLKGLSTDALEATYRHIVLTPGAIALVRTMRANGAYTVMVSGGFTFFTGRIAARVGFDEHRGNTLEIDGTRLTGRVGEPILDRDSKLRTLFELSEKKAIPTALTMAVGDGANDLPMIQAAGMGVAFRAKPVTAAGAAARIDHAGLEALLYLQGYRRDEFAPAEAVPA